MFRIWPPMKDILPGRGPGADARLVVVPHQLVHLIEPTTGQAPESVRPVNFKN